MLEYSLHENVLTDRKDDYSAKTHPKVSYNKEEFIDLMLQRGTLMTKTDALAVLNNIEETAAYVISNGGTLNLPLFHTGFSISGVFEGSTDSFDPHRHHLHVNISKGTLLRAIEQDVKLTKVNTASPHPQILEVKDSVSGKIDEALTAGGAVEIDGVNIKISGDSHLCGLYFVDENGAETKALTLIHNKPSTVLALIPMLAAGNYRVKIVTQYTGSYNWKTPKTTVFGATLQVQ
ncbi:MAG: DUF4469 domain-containing protein [Prevotellaceae bacterium]|jgi:hypothetical protein|nr:DUF4469 domain-containing protein [Prevotellaceae bacterium]